MKISLVLVCTYAIFSIKRIQGSSIGAPFYPLEPEDLTDGDIKELEYLEKYYHRPKRTLFPSDPLSGSAGIITHLKSVAVAGAKQKIAGALAGTVAAASTGAQAIGKSFGGAVLGSAGAISQLKAALLTETTKKIAGASAGVAAASVASVTAAKNLKTGITSTIGLIASGSAKAAGGASAGIGSASAGAHSFKTAALKGIATKIASGSAKAAIGLATAGSAALGTGANSLKGAAFSSANFFFQLKSALITGLLKNIGLIAAGSAKAATGASAGLKTKFGQVSADIAAGSAEAIGQLKHAVVAGTKKKLGQAASSLAGAVTGAVGSASAGAGQLARGVFTESSKLVNNLKSAVILKATSTLGQIASGSAGLIVAGSGALGNGAKGAITGSASAISQLKTAAVTGVAKKIGDVASASLSASAGSAAKASAASAQFGVGAVKGSFDAINQIKSAAVKGITTKIGQAASLSAATSGHIVKTSASVAVAGTKAKIGALAAGSTNIITELSAAKSGKSKRSVNSEAAELYLGLPKRSQSAWSSGSGSGSADIVGQLKSAVVSGLKKKLGQVAQGSAGALAGGSAGFSKGSFGGGGKTYEHHDHPYEPDHSYEHKPQLDVWELKKSVFNTLLQAVKAIKGGVLAIKGQLIKGSGYVVAGGGKLLAAGGDKVSSLGKNIISSAVLVHPHKEHHVHSEYGHPSASYTAPSGPPIIYDAPHSSGPSYESHYESPYDHHSDKLAHGSHAGILLLKKIPSSHDTYHTSYSHHEESKVPSFKPLHPTGPSAGNIFGKFFTASTSLDPSQPAPFGDTAHGVEYESHGVSHTESHHHYPAEESHGVSHTESHHHYPAEESHAAVHPPAPSYHEEPRVKFEAAAPPSFQVPLIKEHKVGPSAGNADFHAPSDNFNDHLHLPSAPATSYGLSASPATSYGASLEGNHNFINVHDHLGAESSNKNEQKVKLTKGELLDHLESSPTLASSQITMPKDAPKSFEALKSALKSNLLRQPSSSEVLASGEILSKPSQGLKGPVFFPNEDQEYFSEDLPSYSRFKKAPSKSGFSQNLVATTDNLLEAFLPQKHALKPPSSSKELFDGLSSAESYHKYLERFPFHRTSPSSSRPKSSKSKSKNPPKLRMQSDHRQRRPSTKGNYNVIKSMSYEITSDGVKRLT